MIKLRYLSAALMMGASFPGLLIAKPIRLKSPVLKLLDGVTYALDGDCMKDMLCIRREVRIIQYGKRDSETGKMVGHYEFNGERYSIHQLAQIEHEIEQQCTANKAAVSIDDPDRRKIMAAIDAERMAQLEALKPCLRQAKDDFKRVNEPYIESTRGTKSMTLHLVHESCELRNREDSFLMEWSSVPEGKEFDSFEETMKTFQKLDTFCSDLTNFMDDVIYSCPKGCAQAGLNIPH